MALVFSKFNIPLATALSRVGLDGFFLALLGVVGLAYLRPNWGSDAGPLPLDAIASYGVSLIFFFYGLRLSREKLRAGLRNGWLHVLIQATTFVVFPLLALALHGLFTGPTGETLWLGLFFLAALPSTVSSSVVMVSLARGNLPAAIFNASISSLVGILLTPLWVSAVMMVGSGSLPFWSMVGDLALRVALPVAVGVALNSRLGAWAGRHQNALRGFDQSIILLTIYTSFCDSFSEGVFNGYGAGTLLALGAGMMGLFFVVFGLVNFLSRWLRFPTEDRITALFCGSKKSLVHGTVMAQVLFAGNPLTGVLLLPLMIYHALQLLAGSAIAKRMGRRSEGTDAVAGADSSA